MSIDNYIKQLEQSHVFDSYIEDDKNKEIEYMKNHRYRFIEILNSIPNVSESINLLDIGPTPFTIFIKSLYPHFHLFALDRTNHLKKRFLEKGIEIAQTDLDDCQLPYEDNYFDLVIFTEVLEHVFAPPTAVLNEIKRIMRFGSKLIISVPNIATLKNRVKLLFGKSPLSNPDLQLRKEWIHGHGHLHEYTMNELIKLLTGCGFTILSKKYLSIKRPFCLTKAISRQFIEALKTIDRAVSIMIPSFRGTIFIECCK